MDLEKRFCEFITLKNRELLLPKNRDLYDKLFEKYEQTYLEMDEDKMIKQYGQLEDAFLEKLFGKKSKKKLC